MGREEPSQGLAPSAVRKDQRAKHAKATINKTIPAILKSDASARKGLENAELIVDPPAFARAERPNDAAKSQLAISLEVADTLSVAHRLHQKGGAVAMLNMASPLRPGGGVLNGATSQEETLCIRTTLLPSLREEWYRLPEVGGIWSPDVCVFRLPADARGDSDREMNKNERFHVGVVTAAMLRHPEVAEDETGARKYAKEADREMVVRKMKAVMRILSRKGVERVVLGAWGCGAFGNPVEEIAKAWKRVIFGPPKRSKGKDAAESFGKLKEVVFAIKEASMASHFANAWGSGLEMVSNPERGEPVEDSRAGYEELRAKIEELELQMAQTKILMVKERLANIVLGLKEQLAERDINEEKELDGDVDEDMS